MTDELSFKELYEVSLKSTSSIEVGGRTIEVGETIAIFDKINIANFREIKDHVSANGGYGNRPLITWESTKEIDISFSQGTFSKTQLALMSNANLITNNGEERIPINKREQHESNESKQIYLSHSPIADKPCFVYDVDTGEKISGWKLNNHVITIDKSYTDVLVDYWYEYKNGYSTLQVGKALTQGFLTLVGKMRIKDETGTVKTGIIHIPKLRLMSDLSIRVGSDAAPHIGVLNAVAFPEGARGHQKVMDITFLNDDIDADM